MMEIDIVYGNVPDILFTQSQASWTEAAIVKAVEGYAELLAACENILETWWNRHYPPDIFDGSSGDEGALEVVRIRAMLEAAIAHAHNRDGQVKELEGGEDGNHNED